MKKFKFTIHGNEYDVEILNLEENTVKIDVNGTTYDVEVHREIKTTKTPTLIRNKSVPTHDTDKAKTSKPAERKGAGVVKAPLPGTILEIKVKEGATVKAGDLLLVMEAMKMENNINADKEGVITAIKVKVGDSVLEGDTIVEIGS